MKAEVLTIDNFKCFKHFQISFPALTVLVGANGMGKSSVIQSILLMRSAMEARAKTVKLNGPYGLSLGTNESVLNQEMDSNRVSFSLRNTGGELIGLLKMRGDSKKERLDMDVVDSCSRKTGLFMKEFYYLSAERTGPRIAQKMAPLLFDHTGTMGEFTGQLLAEKFYKYEGALKHPDVQEHRLLPQVNAWMQRILPGIEVWADKVDSMQMSRVLIKNGFTSSFVEATNIGFGISYSLPIVVQGLIAKKNRYFIVENPEAHLHPSAQTEMGKFLAMLAESGVRVIIETHSDHLLDGIQIYVASHGKMREDVTIYHFGQDFNQLCVNEITYDPRFGYSKWPKGFMDQTSINFAEFEELNKRHV